MVTPLCCSMDHTVCTCIAFKIYVLYCIYSTIHLVIRIVYRRRMTGPDTCTPCVPLAQYCIQCQFLYCTQYCIHIQFTYILCATHTFNCSGSGPLFAFQIYIVHSSQVMWSIARAPTEYMTTTSSRDVETCRGYGTSQT